MSGPTDPDTTPDLRMLAVGAASWSGALAAMLLPAGVLAVIAVGAVLVLGTAAFRYRRVSLQGHGHGAITVAVWAAVVLGALANAWVRGDIVDHDPIRDSARRNARIDGTVEIRSDPVQRAGRFGDQVLVRVRLLEATVSGHHVRSAARLLLVADPSWREVRLGARVAVSGRLRTTDARDLAAILTSRGPPVELDEPALGLRAADRVRHAIRDAAQPWRSDARALVPGLVDGDEGRLSETVRDDFRAAGLTHLVAVSGTNLTLIVGFWLILARWLGVRAYGLVIVGLIGVAGFLLLARTEPSVVRAATMGSIALLGMGVGGSKRGTRLLGAAVLVLTLTQPQLAVSAGFALSVLATAGIVLVGPGLRDALLPWLPRWVAEAVAVPLSAQLACTPIVAMLSGQVSLVAVVANLAAAPAVGPATVLGLMGGLVALVTATLGRLVAAPAVWCAQWIVAVAERAAGANGAVVTWPGSFGGIAALAVLCLALAVVLPTVLAARTGTIAAGAVLVGVWLVPVPTPGWPPPGWVMVACDVGQGDGLVLATEPGSAIVVDAGPEPSAIDRCLTRLGVRQVPLLVLTHFHADHVGGVAGVFRGRTVGEILTSPLAEPRAAADAVTDLAAQEHVPVHSATAATHGRTGAVQWQVVAPVTASAAGSSPNDASLVLAVRVHGITLILLGDEEEASQRELRYAHPSLRADVLKVAHHGSAKQDPALVERLGARLAIVSVGTDNDYGHPAPATVRLLERTGARVRRTDLDGDIAVVVDPQGRLGSVGRS